MEAVNDVKPEKERDLQSRVLDGNFLKSIDDRRIGDEQQRADLACANVGLDHFRFHELREVEELIELAHLFVERHPRQQFVHSAIDRRRLCIARQASGSCHYWQVKQDHHERDTGAEQYSEELLLHGSGHNRIVAYCRD